jgi:hypothetical protein
MVWYGMVYITLLMVYDFYFESYVLHTEHVFTRTAKQQPNTCTHCACTPRRSVVIFNITSIFSYNCVFFTIAVNIRFGVYTSACATSGTIWIRHRGTFGCLLLVFTQVLVPKVELFEPDTAAPLDVYCWCLHKCLCHKWNYLNQTAWDLRMFIAGVLYLNRHPLMMVPWAYRNMLGLWSEILLQAIKVRVHVLVCCFATLFWTFFFGI